MKLYLLGFNLVFHIALLKINLSKNIFINPFSNIIIMVKGDCSGFTSLYFISLKYIL